MGLTTNTETREVDFGTYCIKCKHFKKQEWKEPCNDCLAHAVNQYTDKPVHWEDKNE